MKQISSVKCASIAAVCAALCCVLPQAFHAVGLGSALSPMHIPVLLCGLVCGGFYGLLCGVLGPLLSSVLTGMPPAAALVGMLPELAVYGLASGFILNHIRTGKLTADLYIALAGAMLLGRIAGGISNALFFTGEGGYSLALWASSYLIGAVPGIICHLILVPILVVILMKARLIPSRY